MVAWKHKVPLIKTYHAKVFPKLLFISLVIIKWSNQIGGVFVFSYTGDDLVVYIVEFETYEK